MIHVSSHENKQQTWSFSLSNLSHGILERIFNSFKGGSISKSYSLLLHPNNHYSLEMSLSWNFPAKPSYEGSEPSQAEALQFLS